MHDALPGASFIGFTGTPIGLKDPNTRAVLGDYISVYDIQRAVEDKATVPIYYESRRGLLLLASSVAFCRLRTMTHGLLLASALRLLLHCGLVERSGYPYGCGVGRRGEG